MQPKRVLVVDDEPLVCESVKMVLAYQRHHADIARSGEEALAKYDPAQYDMVFTDWNMPGMKGDKLAKALKARDESKPIVMLTAFPMATEPAAVDLVVLKPFTSDTIREAIEKVSASE